MTLFRVVHDKKNPYITVNKSIADDDRLSFKAKGIWFYAFSKPTDWQFYLKDLENRSIDGRDSIQSGLNELIANGYLRIKQKKDSNGRFSRNTWYFFETCKTTDEIKEMFNDDEKIKEMFTANGFSVYGKSISGPHISTILTNEQTLFVADDPVGSPPLKIQIRNSNNEMLSLDQTDLYRSIISKQVDWSSEEIKYAWKSLTEYKGVINDWWAFLSGTVKNFRNKIKSKNASKEGKSWKKKTNQNHSNSKKDSSEEDTVEQPSPPLVSMKEFLKK